MRRAPIALLTTAACAILALPAISGAVPKVGEKSNGWSITDETYLRTYEKCWKAFGEDCDRNLLDSAWKDTEPVSEARIKAATARMDGWLNPPVAPEPVASSSTEYVAPAPVTSSVAPSSGGYAIPEYIVQCESGGDYGAQNASGAYGAYQIMPGTAAAYGCDLSTPGGQDQCAGKIYAAEGASPWACG